MIYHGAYSNDTIYGTINNRMINVETDADADFLICDLEVSINSDMWTHRFEIPFYNNIAEFYFENYVHSIITQKFKLPNIDQENISIYSFDLASIKITLKEMQADTVLDEVEYNFFMILGNLDELSINYLDTGNHYILPIPHTRFITANGLFSFSFLAKSYPDKLIVNDGQIDKDILLPVATPTKTLHTICIPVNNVMSLQSTVFKLSLNFLGTTSYNLGEFCVVDDGLDHNLTFYQNSFGTISMIELTGEIIEEPNYKFSSTTRVIRSKRTVQTTDINYKETYRINTGYWLDNEKYNMLDELLKSFNIYLFIETFKKIIVSKSHKFTRFKTNFHENNESLNFKLSDNDNPIYPTF